MKFHLARFSLTLRILKDQSHRLSMAYIQQCISKSIQDTDRVTIDDG